MCTVIYGILASPFEAIRVLHQSEWEDGHKFPNVSKILLTKTYVDDILTGAVSIEDLLLQQKHIIGLLSGCGFLFKK